MKLGTLATITLLALVPASGCRLGEPDPWTQRARELEQNRQLWRALGARSYRFVLTKSCECLAGFVGPAQITVDTGAIVGVRPLQPGGFPFTPDQWGAFETVETIFSKLDDAIAQRVYSYQATYDPNRGFPVIVSLNYQEPMVDDEVHIEVDSLIVLK